MPFPGYRGGWLAYNEASRAVKDTDWTRPNKIFPSDLKNDPSDRDIFELGPDMWIHHPSVLERKDENGAYVICQYPLRQVRQPLTRHHLPLQTLYLEAVLCQVVRFARTPVDQG